jgi:hypothetical protein
MAALSAEWEGKGVVNWLMLSGFRRKLKIILRCRVEERCVIVFSWVGLLFLSVGLFFPTTGRALETLIFDCGGRVEAEAWEVWDSEARLSLYRKLFLKRLNEGDTYALYDFQTYTHNLMSMARRCNRVERLREFAALIKEAYGALEGSPDREGRGRRWICRGGAICTTGNRLLGSEVMLCSVQFLGVATSVANALAASGATLTQEDKLFIADSMRIAREHLLRWASDSNIKAIVELSQVSAEEVKDNSSKLFFTDKPLWMIGIYAEIAGIVATLDESEMKAWQIPSTDVARLRRHYGALVEFFRARIFLRSLTSGDALNGPVADLDRGYWRLYADNRYAAYTGAEKPVRCMVEENGALKRRSLLAPDAVPLPS